MAKCYGRLGYAKTIETEPGIYEETISTIAYYGYIISDRRSYGEIKNSTNSDLKISNRLSIIAVDPTIDLSKIRYVEFLGSKWNVNDVEIVYPRLILSLGGVYNGD